MVINQADIKADINQTNSRLASLYKQLSTDRKDSTTLNHVWEMNDIFYKTITQYPAEVNALRINWEPNKEMDPRLYDILGRSKLKTDLEAITYCPISDSEFKHTFMMTLPYQTSLAEREGLYRGNDQRNERVKAIKWNNIPCLEINLNYETNPKYGHSNHILLFSEIKEMRFTTVPEDELTPLLGLLRKGYGSEERLLPHAQSSIQNYLDYVGFGQHQINLDKVPKRHKEAFSIERISTSQAFPFLHTRKDLSGFAVAYLDNQPMLCELQNVSDFPFLMKLRHVPLSTLAAYAICRGKDEERIIGYSGNEIIERLFNKLQERNISSK